jgi:hypothetical protein
MRDPRTLTDARLQLHWAAQLAATPGRTLAPPRADDSHTSFRWRDGALVQDDAFRSGLRLRDATLLLGDESLPLDGHTLAEAFTWIAMRLPDVRKEFNESLPEHEVASGGTFSLRDREAFEELDRYYAMTVPLLRAIHDDVRCWPHHFDIATLLEFDGGARTIGAGLSPGDATCDEPYWYVNYWPHDSLKERGRLSGGATWVSEGWNGAMLRASDGGEPATFFREAIAR